MSFSESNGKSPKDFKQRVTGSHFDKIVQAAEWKIELRRAEWKWGSSLGFLLSVLKHFSDFEGLSKSIKQKSKVRYIIKEMETIDLLMLYTYTHMKQMSVT